MEKNLQAADNSLVPDEEKEWNEGAINWQNRTLRHPQTSIV